MERFVLAAALATVSLASYIRPAVLPEAVVTSPLPIASSAPAAAWDWRDYIVLTPITNQYVPRWCGSCWATAVVESLSDRVSVLQLAAGKRQGALRLLSRQVLLDCGWAQMKVGSCNGGSWELAHAFIHAHGITDESCAPYTASDGSCLNQHTFCTLCRSDGTCVPVDNAPRVYVSEFGYVNGTENIMREIQQRGPIPCSMWSHTDAFHCYQGGILRDDNHYNVTTHVVSLVGWGSEAGVDYWVAKHSGGTFWGEDGYFRIEKGKNTLSIESHCGWAVPTLPQRATPTKDMPCEN